MTLGVDYGHGLSNIDLSTGIRYGVISQHSLLFDALDEAFEAVYVPSCPETGDEYTTLAWDTLTSDTDTFTCPVCDREHNTDDCYGDEASYHQSTDTDYDLADCLDTDIMVLRSPYYTYAPFCSPCVPGAGNLDSADGFSPDDGVKTYCLGHDWFDDGHAPYAVYSVADDSIVAA